MLVRSVYLLLFCRMGQAWELPVLMSASLIPGPTLQNTSPRELQKTASETMAPTESPAPSPSPSSSPTNAPTVTGKPTAKPTMSPTESPAPSPSPSSSPTQAPTGVPSSPPTIAPTISRSPTIAPTKNPTDLPTMPPTLSPTQQPTISTAPSNVPTESPTQSPTQNPTISPQPSSSPSARPTVSFQPSSAPSHITMVTGDFSVQFPLSKGLSAQDVAMFESGTASFVSTYSYASGSMDDVSVTVNEQSLVVVDDLPTGRQKLRGLQDFEDSSDEEPMYELLVDFTVDGEYTGKDQGFHLVDELDKEFQSQNQVWITYIASETNTFRPLRSQVSGLQVEEHGSGKGLATTGIVTVIFFALAAIALGIAASVYSVHSHRKSQYGDELRSPVENSNMSPSTVTEREVHPIKTAPSMETEAVLRYGCSPSSRVSGMENCNLEGVFDIPFGRTQTNQTRQSVVTNQTRQSTLSKQSRISQDPPTRGSQIHPRDPRNRSLFDSTNTPSSQSQASPFHNKNRTNMGQANVIGQHSQKIREKNINRMEDGLATELMLTKSMGGTLGATAVDQSNAGASDFSAQARNFFANMLGGQEEKKVKSQVKGRQSEARTQSADEHAQFREKSPYESAAHRAGLYDVFAPAGPIGIVVDTTKDGPAVHSLKPTSPMLGLINPGDLIVGLDDQDTRSMTAATLTRLMARKANQKERKITLLAMDY